MNSYCLNSHQAALYPSLPWNLLNLSLKFIVSSESNANPPRLKMVPDSVFSLVLCYFNMICLMLGNTIHDIFTCPF